MGDLDVLASLPGPIPSPSQLTKAMRQHGVLADDLKFRQFRFKVGDRVKVRPPFGVDDTADARKAYETIYKGKIYEVLAVKFKSMKMIASVDGREYSTFEEVSLLDPKRPGEQLCFPGTFPSPLRWPGSCI